MDQETLTTIEREATKTAWIGMWLFFWCGLALFVERTEFAAGAMLAFLLVWVGSGIIAIKARQKIRATEGGRRM